MGYKYESTASGLHGTPDELFITRCDEGHLNIVVSNSGKGNTVCVPQHTATDVASAVTGYAQISDTRGRANEQSSDEDREFEARSVLVSAGFTPRPDRRYSVDMLEALAGVIETWGQEGWK